MVPNSISTDTNISMGSTSTAPAVAPTVRTVAPATVDGLTLADIKLALNTQEVQIVDQIVSVRTLIPLRIRHQP